MYLKYKCYHAGDMKAYVEMSSFVGICYHYPDDLCCISLANGFEPLVMTMSEDEYNKLVDTLQRGIVDAFCDLTDYVFLGAGGYDLDDAKDVKKVYKICNEMKKKSL